MKTQRSRQTASSVMSARSTVFDSVPPIHDGQSTPAGAPLALRLRAFLTRGKLDRQIAAGRPCEATAALALRARQLTDARTQQQTARELRGVIDYVDRRSSRAVISTVVIDPPAVRTGRQAILELAKRLEGTAPVTPRGVVLARALLTDGLSPLFNPHCERTVAEAACEVQDALDGHPVGAFDAIAA
jgi:hypothetical protein